MTQDISEKDRQNPKTMQVRAQIFRNLADIPELFPKLNMVQHFATIIRSKGGKDFYSWTEEEFLKRIEQYKDELENDMEEWESTED